MITFLLTIISLAHVIWCQSCIYGGETCICKPNRNAWVIRCNTSRSEPSLFPVEFEKLSIFEKHTVFYQYKNMPWIGSNSSLSKSGLQFERLDLSSNQIKTIEPDVFRETFIKLLFMSNNSLTNLDFLTPLCDLEELYIENTQVEYLNASWFRCKTNMTTLSMRFNNIKVVSFQCFYGLMKLTSIDMRDSKIQTLQSEAFSNLPSLTSLKICSYRIKEIQSYAFNNLSSLTSIGCLDLQYMKTLPAFSFAGLTKLSFLSFNNGRLSSISNDAFKELTSLTKMDLQKNFLRELEPGVFSQMPSLKTLDLFENNLIKLARGVLAGLKKLNNLTLIHNRIETIEPFSFIDQSESLEYLDIQDNKLGFIKKSFFSELRALKELNMSNNQISSIEPGSFDSTANLTLLYLDNNCIFSIHPNLFNHLNKLIELTIDHNVILELDRSVFRGLRNLSLLGLRYNRLDSLPDQIFSDLSRLEMLGLGSNRLKSLDSQQLFQGLNSLKWLQLSNNLIEKVSFKSIQFLNRTLDELYIHSNRLVELELNENSIFTALNIIDISSNKKFINASRLMSNLAKCSSCKYDFYFQNMSTEFIYDLVQYFNNLSPLIKQIKGLDLSFNDLSSLFDLIPFSVMASSLTELRLENTNINSSVSFLKDFDSIQFIDLSGNQVALSSEYFTFKHIQYFYASNTGLKNLTTELGRIGSAVILDLSSNLIEVVTHKIFVLNSYLRVLNLSHNRIRLIEDSAFDVSTLSILDFSHNLLTSLTDSIFVPSDSFINELSSLYLNNNQLSLFSYYKLVDDLYLQDNYLGDEIYLTVSKSLNLNRNNLTLIHQTISGSHMTELSLSNNQITHIEDNTFTEYYSLSRLDLSLNLIRNLSTKTFRGLVVLDYLNLSSNFIEIINQDVLKNVIKLAELDLNNNSIKFIMDNSFANLASLQDLYLKDLRMEALTDQTLQGLKSVKFLEINTIQFQLLENVKIMIKSFFKDFKSRNERYTWYTSTNIEFNLPETGIDSRYCSMVLYVAKNNILINLVTDLGRDALISACRMFSFADLEYTKFGFE